jgi:hypothetical protein
MDKKTKDFAIGAGIFLGVSLPVLALFWGYRLSRPLKSPAPFTLNGYEINCGVDRDGNNYGAQFVAEVKYAGTNGILMASMDYEGNDPRPYGKNKFIGGTLTIQLLNKIGTLVVEVVGGEINWSDGGLPPPADPATAGYEHGAEIGSMVFDFKVISKSGAFSNFTGGSFVGADNHPSGVFFNGQQVPTVAGTLTLL